MDISPIEPGLWVASRFYAYDHPGGVLVDLSGEFDAEAAEWADAYVWWPVEDGPVIPDLRGLARAVSSREVIARCDAGRNRSPLFAALVLQARGREANEALETVLRTRTTERMPRCLSNQAFEAYLRTARVLEPVAP